MKASVKTKMAAISCFTQYQVWQCGFLVNSFFDRKEAVGLRNQINSEL